MKADSLFITCEGGEGAGKTTLMQRLEAELQKRGYQVLHTREPGGSRLGEELRQWLLHRDPAMKIGSHAELLLFLAARAQHIEERIKPALEKGVVVLCDRFNDSTIAYQGVARGLGMEYVKQLCHLVCDGVTPNLTFFLDLHPQVGLARAGRVRKSDLMEGEALLFHEKVREGMIELARREPERIQVLDATKSPDEVFEEAMHLVERCLKGFYV